MTEPAQSLDVWQNEMRGRVRRIGWTYLRRELSLAEIDQIISLHSLAAAHIDMEADA